MKPTPLPKPATPITAFFAPVKVNPMTNITMIENVNITIVYNEHGQQMSPRKPSCWEKLTCCFGR